MLDARLAASNPEERAAGCAQARRSHGCVGNLTRGGLPFAPRVLARLRNRAVGWSFRAVSHAVAEYLAVVSAVDPGSGVFRLPGLHANVFELWSIVSDEPF